MGKRGPKPKKIIDETWRPELAYAVGLLATDGCLAKDGLLIDLTSKDREQLENFSRCLGIKFKIGEKKGKNDIKCLRIQFKNKIFCAALHCQKALGSNAFFELFFFAQSNHFFFKTFNQ